MNIFFSHSTDDGVIAERLVRILSEGDKTIHSFYSSDPQTGVLAGEGIMSRINQEIVKSDLFVPIITENYVRSLYCLYELSIAAYLQAQGQASIIPIISSKALYDRINPILSQFDLLYIDAQSASAASIFSQTFSWVAPSQQAAVQEFLDALLLQTVSLRPYIGMDTVTYTGILEYCQQYGIKQIKNTTLPADVVKGKVANAKEVLLLSTTGASLIKALCDDAFPTALSNGCHVSIIIPNQYSDFCEDVAEIEQPNAKEENVTRLAQEYASAMVYLNDAVQQVGNDTTGSICCYCSHTLLRQTVLLVQNQDDTVWGWVSLTMPPKRTVDGTPSLEVEGRLEKGALVYPLWNHCKGIMEVARRRHTWFAVDGTSNRAFFFEKPHAQAYWDKRYQAAKATMEERRGQFDRVLIEVAAQHPLKRRKLPGDEFRHRLDTAIRLFRELEQDGIEAMLYVPGSRHRHNGVDDLVSLSAAGCDYLIGQGIDPQYILGENMNQAYKGDDGVYNSADECYVASRIFLDGEFDQLVCICSPNQVFRKTLFYIEFGVIPQCYSVPTEKMFHNVLYEIFQSLPYVLFEDPSWQNPESEQFRSSRNERAPLKPLEP